MKTLMHKSVVEDSSCSRLAPADYLLVFKKVGKNPEPITHRYGFQDYAGSQAVPPDLLAEFEGYKGDQRKNALSQWIYRQYASPVWMDVRRERLLGGTKNGISAAAKQSLENDEERHVCPLQLDVIDRCLDLWSNPGDVVLTPFMGIGSEAYEAVVKGRKGVGIELKATYYRQAIKSLEFAAETRRRQEAGVYAEAP
jgi:DNA modification methylase